MRNAFKATTCVLLALTTVGFSACGSKSKEGDKNAAKLSDVEFWQTWSTEKILQDNTEMYDDIKAPAEIDITAIRGEEEATQIIMTTGDKRVDSYDVVYSDLTCGTNKLSKDNITVYHQKYITVGAAAEHYTTRGMYPDCLVPFENVKGVKENYIEPNNNQGLYYSVEIPQGQAPGTYTGNLQVTINGETKTIPVSVNVANAEIGVETHFLSCFQVKWKMGEGELDFSNEMLDAYNRKLFEYRCGASNLLYRNEHTDAEIALYADYACEYAKLPQSCGWSLPWNTKSMKNYEYHGRVFTGSFHNPELTQKYILAIAYKALEEKVNPFVKAFVYGRDEPDLNNTGDNVVQNDGFLLHHAKEDAIAILQADESITDQTLLAELIEGIRGVPHVVTSSTFMSVDFDLSEEDMVYCPEFQYIETKELQDKYRMSESNDLWWYGCCNPDNPYPTYHIDDTVLSARLLSWMQADYNIQGNLYWATDYYSGGSYKDLDDYYTGNAARSTATNGEGYLFYPGKKYGVYGGLPSVRLEQIRDGMEEAEMILALRKAYEKVSASIGESFTEDGIMSYLYDSMYSGTRVSTTNEVFAQNRQSLINLLSMAQSSAELCVMSVQETATGYQFEVYANEGYALTYNGKAVTQKRAVSGGNVYTVMLSLTKGETFNIGVDVDGMKLGLNMSFGSEMRLYDAKYMYDGGLLSKRSVEFTQTLVDAKTVNPNAADGEKYIQLAYEVADAKKKQDFILKDDSVIKKLDDKADKFIFRIYNASNATIKADLHFEYGNEPGIYTQYTTVNLEPGMNTVTVSNLYGFRWSKLKYISKMRFTFGGYGDGKRDCLYVVDMSVYMK